MSESELLKTSDVAKLFRVTPKTVVRWAALGKIPHMRTLGGQFRYRADEIQALVNQQTSTETASV